MLSVLRQLLTVAVAALLVFATSSGQGQSFMPRGAMEELPSQTSTLLFEDHVVGYQNKVYLFQAQKRLSDKPCFRKSALSLVSPPVAADNIPFIFGHRDAGIYRHNLNRGPPAPSV